VTEHSEKSVADPKHLYIVFNINVSISCKLYEQKMYFYLAKLIFIYFEVQTKMNFL
jgi:hypothetical protein